MKTKILLIFPPYSKQALSYYPPLGLGYIAAYILSKNPHLNVKIIDFTIQEFSVEGWKKELKNFSPDIVGISVLALNFPFGALISKLTKVVDPRIITVMGGAHATAMPADCLNYCDIVVRGEGEESFWDIITDKDLSNIQGISYRYDEEIIHNGERERIKDLDALPFPAHSLFSIKDYRCFPAWGIMSARGCPFNCIFCSSPNRWKRIICFRGIDSILNEIEYLYSDFGIRSITFFDDTINITQQRAADICDEIIERGLNKKMQFTCQMKANKQLVSLELFEKMKKANFVQIEFGIESGSQRILNSIRKSLTIDEAKRAIALARKAGIPVVHGFFIIGNRDETFLDVLKTWQFILSTEIFPTFSICEPFPGTTLYDMLKEEGTIPQNLDLSRLTLVAPRVKTSKMSISRVLLLYICSIALLQLPLSLVRGHKFKHTFTSIIRNALNKP